MDDTPAPGPPPPSSLAPRVPSAPRGTTVLRIRWGIGDFFLVVGVQVAAGLLAALALAAAGEVKPDGDISPALEFWVLVPVQAVAGLAALAGVSRVKGTGSLRRDFGLALRLRDGTALPLGFALQFAFAAVLLPITLLLDADEPAQEVVQRIDQTRGAGTWVAIVLGVAVVQPAFEELLFRGLLLTALLRKTTPEWAVGISAMAFGASHLFGTGATLEGLVTAVALSGLGIILAWQAVRHRSLGRPILTHVGFNLAVLVLSLLG